ncbi:hypothetical protein F5J12DRAFT_774053 [Pisolithus orientalis]|uniref:uncharacterized protein n=1 Tax=Pisolithus orientalis TaxID=936130 RepID=UPI00222544DB|nr:uncharacterized protein F5J12DRAFT_774053 [Pisolithus orientalis]KAI5991047.1 hypothetical protein F5J12DRAFT_774053 [Pisolithus orientalis]
MSDGFSLCCWVRGTSVAATFIITISRTATVYTLRDLIKESASLEVPAPALQLFKLKNPLRRPYKETLNGSLNTNNDGTLLNGRQKISACFEGTTVLETFCVIVQFPCQDVIALNYWIIGEDIHTILEVKVARTQTAGDLKRLIKAENAVTLHDTDVRLLTLWNVSLPCDDALKQTIEGLDLRPERSLHSMKRLSTIFAEPPVPEHLHIIVGLPHAGELSIMIAS